jgi:hypothetical protein
MITKGVFVAVPWAHGDYVISEQEFLDLARARAALSRAQRMIEAAQVERDIDRLGELGREVQAAKRSGYQVGKSHSVRKRGKTNAFTAAQLTIATRALEHLESKSA